MIAIVGIDPGFASLGYAVIAIDGAAERVVRFGVFETDASSKKANVLATADNLRRGGEIARFLRELVHDVAPIAIAAEAMSFPRSSSVAAKVAMCWGALAAVSEASGVPVLQTSPQAVKRALTGSKGASKEDVQIALLALYPEIDTLRAGLTKGRWEHPHDALAVAHVMLGSDVVRAVRAATRGA